MADRSKIEWTDATWNPIVGCKKVSEGCRNCYAMGAAARLERIGVPHYAGLTRLGRQGVEWTGQIARAPEHILTQPLRWRRPRTVFVNSMSDLFHEDVPDELIDQVFAVMALAPQHRFIVLTKRPERMRTYMITPGMRSRCNRLVWHIGCDNRGATWPNVILGTSVEDQATAEERVPALLDTPAAVRIMSAEPLLGPLDVWNWIPAPYQPSIDPLATPGPPYLACVITGGETGPGARPAHLDWFRAIRDQCAAAGVAYFHKQNGEWAPDQGPFSDGGDPIVESRARCALWTGERWRYADDGYLFTDEDGGDDDWMYRIGKRRAGRLLDGRTHDEMPA